MFAIIAAIAFFLALLIDIAKADIGIGAGTFVTIGLLCLALHMAGLGAAVRGRAGRRSFRR
jgi:hypothetical protein